MICGLEIHQRLSGRKLFCSCAPEEGDAQKSKAEFSRRLHLVASELGELDATAKLEARRNRSFHYAASPSSSCLVECDEEPPHQANPEALLATLAICELLSSRPMDEIHVMRKNVIDGSNTSGFQRTALVGLGGKIKVGEKEVGIQSVCLEEESAGLVEGQESKAAYDLTRLGIPLIEIATAPVLGSGEEAQQAAEAIGGLLRKTGLVSRGIGTIRQDLNISVGGGARVEIKGVQELGMIAATVETEARRQQALVQISSEAKQRLSGREIPQAFYDVTSIFSETRAAMVAKSIKAGSRAFALPLPGFAGLVGREVSPNRRFGSELADYARACGVRGLIHSDEDMAKYGISEDEVSETRLALSLSEHDAFAIVLADEKKAKEALSAVAERVAVFGVPEETRKASPDGTSSYMRPLPGKARMYPETDLEPIEVTGSMIERAREKAGEITRMESDKEKILTGVNPELAAQLTAIRGLISHNSAHRLLAQTPELSVFASALNDGVDAKFAAAVLTNTLQALRREGTNTRLLDEPRLLSALRAWKEGVFTKAAVPEVLRKMCEGAAVSPEEAAAKAGAERISGALLSKLIAEERLELPALMAKYRLRVDAAEAQEIYKGMK